MLDTLAYLFLNTRLGIFLIAIIVCLLIIILGSFISHKDYNNIGVGFQALCTAFLFFFVLTYVFF